MNDGIFSLSMSTNTLEERITSMITTTTTINTIMTQEEEEGGRKSGSSSYYSTSSASSSAENISNVGSGELFIFTFMTAAGQRSGPIFPASDSTISYHRHASNLSRPHHISSCSSTSPSSHAASQPCSNCRKEPPTHSTYPVNCFCTRPCTSNDLCDWRSSSDSKWRETDFCSNPSRCFDSQDFWSSPQSLRFDGSHKYSYKKNNASCPHRDRNNHPFQSLIEDLFRIIPDNTEGTLLRSMEKGVLFPVIHWSSKCNENLTHHSQLGHNLIFNQGVYKELKRVIPPDVWLRKDPEFQRGVQHQTWILIGYKSLEKSLDSSLEATWKEWTGARNIYLNLRQDFEVGKISFLIRVHPEDNLDLFMYLVLMEIGNVTERNLIWLLDFVQRTRMERMKGFLTVYTEVDQSRIPTIEDEYAKYVNEVSQSNGRAPSPVENHPYSRSSHFRNGTSNGVPAQNGSSTGNGVSKSHSHSFTPLKSATSSASSSTTSQDEAMPLVEATMEMNGNLKLIEKLLQEIHEPFNSDYL